MPNQCLIISTYSRGSGNSDPKNESTQDVKIQVQPGENYQESESQTSTLPMICP